MPLESTFKDRTQEFLNTSVAPISNQLDQDAKQLTQVFNSFKQLNVLHLLIPERNGGLGGSQKTLSEFNMLVAPYSASLLFLQAQHQYAMLTLLSLNGEKIDDLYRAIIQDDTGLAIALAAKKQLVNTQKTDHGFCISGTLPWVSGYQILDRIFISFLSGDQLYYATIPFENCTQNNGRITCSTALEMMVANAVNTVEVELDNWFVSSEDIIYQGNIDDQPPSPTHPNIYNFAAVSQALLNEVLKSKHIDKPNVQQQYQKLLQRLTAYLNTIAQMTFSDPLAIRTQGLQLAEDCSRFTRIVLGGKALRTGSNVQRLCREVWLYTVTGLNEKVLDAYLK